MSKKPQIALHHTALTLTSGRRSGKMAKFNDELKKALGDYPVRGSGTITAILESCERRTYFAGVDLGKGMDQTSIVVVRRQGGVTKVVS